MINLFRFFSGGTNENKVIIPWFVISELRIAQELRRIPVSIPVSVEQLFGSNLDSSSTSLPKTLSSKTIFDSAKLHAANLHKILLPLKIIG